MPESGIKAKEEVKNAYSLVMKSGKGIPYAVFRFTPDAKYIIVDRDPKYYEKELSYDDLMKIMPSNEPRFIAFEFPHLTKDTGLKKKTPILVSWFPPNCGMKWKFIVGCTFLTLGTDLNANKKAEGDSLGDLNYEEVCKKFEFPPVPADQLDDLTGRVVNINEQVPQDD